MAEQLAAVSLENCDKLAGTDKPFILVLKLGDNLFESILRVAEKMQLKSASLSGLGALCDANLAYYYLDKKEYKTEVHQGMFELVSLHGNIGFVDGKHALHIHVALGQENYNVIGGHLMDANVGPSAEITVIPLTGKINRELDANIGLKLMCPI